MKSDQYYLSELEDKIIETVEAYMKNVSRPFSILLSGGFDSGLLAALTKPDSAYRVKFDEAGYDESRYADAIADHLELKLFELPFGKREFEENVKDAVKAMGEPVSHFSLVPFYYLMKSLKDIGKTDVLSGEGPDEYLGGYARQIIFDELKKLYEIPELRNYYGIINKVLGEDILKKYYDLMGYQVTSKNREEQFKEYPFQGIIGKMDMELGVIEKMEQKMAHANGIRLHYPYIEPLFAEYCYHLPDHLKIRNGVTKWAFRQICKKYLPEMMWDRSKMGGPVAPINKWIGGQEYNKDKWLEFQKNILNGN